MPDFLSREERSLHMGLVRSRDTKFEIRILKQISAKIYPLGFRYRKHYKRVYGTPDIAFMKAKVAVFFDSDFWHGKNYAKMKPKLSEAWRRKIERNIERDLEVNDRLVSLGWKVLRYGQTQIKTCPNEIVDEICLTLEASSI